MSWWTTINGARVFVKDKESVDEAFKRTTGKDLNPSKENDTHQQVNEKLKETINEQKGGKSGKIKNPNAARFSGLFTQQINEHIYAMNQEVKVKYHKRTNYNTRQWYHEKLQAIPSLLEGVENKTLDIQSKVAYSIREETRTQARDLMKNKEDREMLEKERKSLTYEQLIEYKKEQHGFKTDDEAKESIIKTATKPSPEFDKLAEKDKDEEDDE